MIRALRSVGLLAEAVVVSLAVRVSLRTRGMRRTLVLARRALPPSRRGGRADRDVAGEVDRAVRRVGAHRPFAYTCLPRSLTTALMLRRRGVAAEHRLGIATSVVAAGAPGGAEPGFLAHAWVEVDGTPLGETPAGLAGIRVVPLDAFLAASVGSRP